MKTPEQIRNIEFQKSTMGGYKQSDVELFLEEVASQIELLMHQKADADRKLQELSQKAPEGALSAAGIQNILINAQQTADKIIETANEDAARIRAEAQLDIKQAEIKAKEIIAEAEGNAVLLGETAEREAAKIIAEAVKNAEEVVLAAKESVELEQKLYDRLVLEVSDFRKKAISQCSSVLELINQLPGEIPFNMERAKAVLSIDFNNPEELLNKAVEERLATAKAEEDAAAEMKALAEQEAQRQAAAEAERIEAEKKAKEEEEARKAAEQKAIEEAKAAEEAAAEEKPEEKTEEVVFEEDVIIEEPVVEDISSLFEENTKEESTVAFDDNAIPVQAAPVNPVVTNMQLSFDDEPEEMEEKQKIFGKDQNQKHAKGRISFGVDDDDDDDEPRLFFKKKKK